MTSFIVRVEMHHAITEAIYNQLHAAMEQAGFTRKIKADDGIWYWLPTAMYICTFGGDASAVMLAAAKAAATTGLTSTVFAAKMDGWSSRGLIAA